MADHGSMKQGISRNFILFLLTSALANDGKLAQTLRSGYVIGHRLQKDIDQGFEE